MRKLLLSAATASLALLAFTLPVAQDGTSETRAKELLAPFVGTWDTTFEFTDMPDMKSKGSEVVTTLPHGLAVMIHNSSDMGPMGSYEGHGMLGYEPKTGKWMHVWTDTTKPGMFMSEGKWSEDGKSFIVESEEDMGMGPMKVVMTMHVDDADHLTWTMRPAGAADAPAMMTMKYTRRK